LQIVRKREPGSSAAPNAPISRHASTSSRQIAIASASRSCAAITRSTAHRRFRAVGLAEAIRSASEGASTAPNAPATPIAGAPRTASRRSASITSSAVVSRSTTSSSGSRVWSRISSASPVQCTVGITIRG
jgi:hypothetical protein